MSISGVFGYLRNYIWNEFYTTPPLVRYGLAGLGFILGIGTTRYGHVGAHPYFLEVLPLISGYNPILGLYYALGFMVGDMIVKPFESTTIPWVLFFIIHIAIIIYAVLPPLFSRGLVYLVYSMGLFKRDGGLPALNIGSLITSAIGGLIGVGVGLWFIDNAMHYAYIDGPQVLGSYPDEACLSIARNSDMFNPARVSTATLFSGPVGGILNNLVSIGFIPNVSRLLKGEVSRLEVPRSLEKQLKKMTKESKVVKEIKGKVSQAKAVKTIKEKTAGSPIVDTLKGYLDKVSETVGEFVVPSGDWQPVNLNLFGNLLTFADEGFDLFSKYVIDKKYIDPLEKAFSNLLNRYYEATYMMDIAKNDYKDVLKKVKIKWNLVIKPKEYTKVAKRYMDSVRKVKSLVREGRAIHREIMKIKRAKGFVKGLFRWTSNILFARDVASDLAVYRVDDGESILGAFTKSFLTNYAVKRVTDFNSVGFATMEMVNEVAFDNSEAAEIISPTNFIKGEAKFVYDLGENLLRDRSLSKAWSKVRKNISKGDYGKVIKYVYSGFEELGEYARDPRLFREVLENKGLSAGLEGVEDKAGEFYDGVHKRIDEVFKVSEKSWKVTKFAAGSVRTVLHGWTNLIELGHRTLTSITGWFRG